MLFWDLNKGSTNQVCDAFSIGIDMKKLDRVVSHHTAYGTGFCPIVSDILILVHPRVATFSRTAEFADLVFFWFCFLFSQSFGSILPWEMNIPTWYWFYIIFSSSPESQSSLGSRIAFAYIMQITFGTEQAFQCTGNNQSIAIAFELLASLSIFHTDQIKKYRFISLYYLMW